LPAARKAAAGRMPRKTAAAPAPGPAPAAVAQAPAVSPDDDYKRTSYAVWEITLKCNLKCSHCGSRAGPKRPDELTTAEALDLVRQLDECGIREVSLIGGEAFLRRDWLEIARAIVARGMVLTMTTGGYGISRALARRMKDAGFAFVSVSIDGLEPTHDRLRGVEGSFRACFETIDHFRAVGLPYGCNTQVNRLSAPEIPRLYELIEAAGVLAWQYQMTVPMGHAADHPEILLQPAELCDVYDMLARVTNRANRAGLVVSPGSSIGYFGPYEHIIRYHALRTNSFWMGCQAGLSTLGIEADGKIKGDPSLPTDAYTGGNIRDRPLREILETPELTFNLGGGTPRGTEHLWGFCKECDYADLCRAGCSWTTHVFFGRRGNNVYCHHRALEMRGRGRRERVRQKLLAIGKPFDHGVFEIIEEPAGAPWPEGDALRFTADKVVWPEGWERWPQP